MSTTVRTYRHGTLKLKDGTPQEMTVTLLDGGWSGAIKGKPIIPIIDRGVVDQVIFGDNELLPFSFTTNFRELYGESAAVLTATLTPYEFITADTNNTLTTALLSVDATQEPYLFDAELTIANPTGSGSEVFTWGECYCPSIRFEEGLPNKLSFEGECQSFTPSSTI